MRRRIRRGNPDRQRPSNSLVEQTKQVRRTINDQPGWNNRVALVGRFALSCRSVTFSELFEVHSQDSLPGFTPRVHLQGSLPIVLSYDPRGMAFLGC
jgi:hypothetical protein